MTADALDPLIHVPARLQIMATLAALPNGDQLSFTPLQDMIGLTPGNLITHLRRLEDAGYLLPPEKRIGQAAMWRPPGVRWAPTWTATATSRLAAISRVLAVWRSSSA